MLFFFLILGVPFVIALVSLLRPDLLDTFISDWPWERRRGDSQARDGVERPGRPRTY